MAHPDIETVILSLIGMSGERHGIVVLEESDHIPPKYVQLFLGARYLVLWMLLSSCAIGVPMRRKRYYALCLNLDTMLYVGPRQENLDFEFRCVVQSRVFLEADDFSFLDSEESRHRELMHLANSEGVQGATEDLIKLPLRKLLPHGKAEFLRGNENLYIAQTGGRGSLVCDVSQNPRHRSRIGAWFPGATRTSHVCSISNDCFFTPSKVDFSLGFPLSSVPS